MKISPLRPTRPKPVALLVPGNRELSVETVWGHSLYRGRRDVERALSKLSDFVCYVAVGIERMKQTTGATSWTMSTWHGRETRMTHEPSGTTVTSLRGTLEYAQDPFAELMKALDWLGEFNVNPAGISAMSWNLLRASLTDVVTLGVDPALASPAFFGGRQGIDQPGSYFMHKLVDKVAAYPTAMAARPVALGLHRVDPTTRLDPTVAGLAKATVVVGTEIDYPPLPQRISPEAIQFQWGVLHGTWTWNELAHAIDLGCEVVVEECYAPSREYDLFFNWWQMAQEGRQLPGAAAKIAKAVANSLWGQLAMTGDDRAEVRWTDDKGLDPFVVHLDPKRLPHEYGRHVAAEVTARVRVELSQALYETGVRAAHIDTDGLILPETAPMPKNTGTGFGQFRVKEDMFEVEIRAPQFYRFKRNSPDPSWHYVASGMNEHQATEVFRQKGRIATTISFLAEPDVVLPDGFSMDWSRNERLLAEAKALR